MSEPCDELYCLTVAEFLEFELYFECAQYLQCVPSDLPALKQREPLRFQQAARHIIKNVVSPQCRRHVQDKQRDAIAAAAIRR
jgi:hypothetical protein